MYDIITVGSATVDVFIHTDPKQTEIIKHKDHNDVAYMLGSKILVQKLSVFTGGGGTNTAVGFSRLGLKTGYIGSLGNDENSKIILDELKREKISFLGHTANILKSDSLNNKSTGYSVILDSIKEDRTIFAYKGANDFLNPQVIEKKIKNGIIKTKWFYFCSMIGQSFESQKKLVKYASKNNIKIVYNPSLYITKNGYKPIYEILKHTEILIFNKEEAESLLNKNFLESDFLSQKRFFSKISGLGPKIVVITDGKNGCYVYDSKDKSIYLSKPKPIKILETTGAGDAFSVGFVSGLLLKKTIPDAIKLGMSNAESVIQHLGAKNILLDSSKIKKIITDTRQIFRV